MEFLGVGPLELFFILIIALIFLGPSDMVKAGRTLGRFLRRLVTSPTWQAVQQTSRDLRYLPNKLMREAGMEEDVEEMKQIGRDLSKEADMLRSLRNPLSAASDEIKQEVNLSTQSLSAWTTPPTAGSTAAGSAAADSAAADPSTTGPEAVAPDQAPMTTGPVEVYSAAPETDPIQPPTEPNLS